MENKLFNVHNQYEIYLEKSGLADQDLGEIQKTETKRAFMAGFGQSIVLLTQEVAKLDEKEGVKIIKSLIRQVQDYFTEELRKFQEREEK